MRLSRPVIGITMGDPAGIGPEIIVKALNYSQVYKWCCPIVIGDFGVMEREVKLLRVRKRINKIKHINEAIFDGDIINVYDLGLNLKEVKVGHISADAGEAAYQSIKKSIELALRGEIDAVATAPVSKEAINLAGYDFRGHTEIFAKLTGAKKYAMLLVSGSFRVAHVTTHISLKEVFNQIRKERVLEVIELLHNACKEFGIKNPKLAVAGLNPHAGENGLLGDEEIREIIPAIDEAKGKGIDVQGPFPPDVIFPIVYGGKFDGCVAMYHDQGHIPFKLLSFKWSKRGVRVRGINITLGLPIVRTSVDHGTAFDIAGKGIASEGAMVEAIKYSVIISKNRKLRKNDSCNSG